MAEIKTVVGRWLGPGLVAILLMAGFLGVRGLWLQHNAQHAQAERDHVILQQVIKAFCTTSPGACK